MIKRDADFLIQKNRKVRIIEFENLFFNIFETEPWETSTARMNRAASIFNATNYMMSISQPIINETFEILAESMRPVNFENAFHTVDQACAILNQKGFETKNTSDKVKLRLREFSKQPQINTQYGLTIQDFFSKEGVNSALFKPIKFFL